MFHSSNARPGLALGLLFGLALSASATETTGTIRSVDTKRNEIALKGLLNDTTYRLADKAYLILDGRKAKLGDLREGDRVTIEYMKRNDNNFASIVRALRNASETTGNVRAVNAQQSQLVIKGILKDTTYQMEKGVTVWINGKRSQLSDLREGEEVRITYQRRDDRLMASEVTLTRK